MFIFLLALLPLQPPPPASPYEPVRIVRDAWGIAHVFAESDQGAFFGAGYAAAQDRLFAMHRSRRAAQGRLAELVGLMGATRSATVDQDKNMRQRAFYRYAQKRAQNLDPLTRQALDSYSQGINYYIQSHKERLLDSWKGEIPEAWTPADCLAVWDRLADFFSGFPSSEAKSLHDFESLTAELGSEAKAIQALQGNPIYDEDAAVVQKADVDPTTLRAIADYAATYHPTGGSGFYGWPLDGEPAPKFSHAWVVSGARTTTGAVVLHSDPQTQISAPSIWYEIHLRGASFDVRGIGVAGCPAQLLGWNRRVAWGVTALGADQADLFRLKMIGTNRYKYDGIAYDMEVRQEEILVKEGKSTLIQLKDTLLGPVVTDLVQDVRPGEEYVLKAIPQWDMDKHSVQAMLDMFRATDVYTFFSAIQRWRGPGIHCLFGDSQGNIGYSLMAAIPTRSSHSPLAGTVAQNGGSSLYDWVRTVPFEALPHVFNPPSGALFSANHAPVGSWYPIPLHLGTGGVSDTTRSWRLRERLRSAAPPILSPQEVLDIHFDSIHPARREMVRAGLHLRDVQKAPLSSSALKALGVLETWYLSGSKSLASEPFQAVAFHLKLQFRQNDAPELIRLYGGGEGGLSYWLKSLKNRLDRDSQALLSSPEIAYIDGSLANGWNTAAQTYGSDERQWQSRFAAGPGKVTVPFFATLEGFGSMDSRLDVIASGMQNVDGGTIWSQRSQSYSQWVNLGDINTSKALLPIGIAEDPGSRFYKDELDAWIAGGMRAAPLEASLIEAMAVSREVIPFPAAGNPARHRRN